MLDRNNAVLLIADIVAISFIGVIPLNIYILMSYHYSICIATFCFVSTFEITIAFTVIFVIVVCLVINAKSLNL